jgi:hypothetical protein
MGHMRIIDGSGDQHVEWDVEETETVVKASKMFDELLKTYPYTAFSVDPKTKDSEQIYKFDPDAETIVLVPPLQGG